VADRRAVVTGGAQGIVFEVKKRLLMDGSAVTLCNLRSYVCAKVQKARNDRDAALINLPKIFQDAVQLETAAELVATTQDRAAFLSTVLGVADEKVLCRGLLG
jgi:NAD(P)-dependent dehydrogenase (short-subunit alcohol dehydrogenase family)